MEITLAYRNKKTHSKSLLKILDLKVHEKHGFSFPLKPFNLVVQDSNPKIFSKYKT